MAAGCSWRLQRGDRLGLGVTADRPTLSARDRQNCPLRWEAGREFRFRQQRRGIKVYRMRSYRELGKRTQQGAEEIFMDSEATESASRVMRFFSNPVIGITGSIASVIGVGLSAFLYMASTTNRDLVYFVDPVRTAIARAKQSSRISIQVDGEPITRDVTAAQIAIWNNGKESIRQGNLLGSGLLLIETGRENPIIDAKVLQVSRDEVIKLTLDSSEIGVGRLGVKWAILEQHDAALLQLIYFGDDKAPITVSAAVQKPGQIRARVERELVYRVIRVVSSAVSGLVEVVS